ncbi:MAG: lysylphosphatidylglycerol synthase transmembrane domain-containing protein, partial [Anaerolineae bacterium]|nr:lysylphosphatidylglycerol synthase transmembrane domain-containing protein [Anaerolineae bacterium]
MLVGTGDGHGVHVGADVAVGMGWVAVAVGEGVGVGDGVGVGAWRNAALHAEMIAAQQSAATSNRLWVDDRMDSCLQVVGEVIAGGVFCQIGMLLTRAWPTGRIGFRCAPQDAGRTEEVPIRTPSSRRKRRNISLALGTLLSLLFLWLAFRQVHLREVWDALRQANAWLVGAALAAFLATQAVKAARWKALFYPEHKGRRFGKLMSVIYIGQAVNAAIPARLGEIARAYLLARIESISGAYVMGTIVLEKALDSLMLLLVVL